MVVRLPRRRLGRAGGVSRRWSVTSRTWRTSAAGCATWFRRTQSPEGRNEDPWRAHRGTAVAVGLDPGEAGGGIRGCEGHDVKAGGGGEETPPRAHPRQDHARSGLSRWRCRTNRAPLRTGRRRRSAVKCPWAAEGSKGWGPIASLQGEEAKRVLLRDVCEALDGQHRMRRLPYPLPHRRKSGMITRRKLVLYGIVTSSQSGSATPTSSWAGNPGVCIVWIVEAQQLLHPSPRKPLEPLVHPPVASRARAHASLSTSPAGSFLSSSFTSGSANGSKYGSTSPRDAFTRLRSKARKSVVHSGPLPSAGP